MRPDLPLTSRPRRRAGLPTAGRPGGASERPWLTRRRAIAVVCSLAAGWVAYGVYGETAAGRAADARIQQLQQQNAALQQDISQRRQDVQAAGTDAWLIQEARRRGYVLPGERVYVPVAGPSLPPDGGVALPTAQPAPAPAPGAHPATAAPSPRPVLTPAPAAVGPTPYVVVVPTPATGR